VLDDDGNVFASSIHFDEADNKRKLDASELVCSGFVANTHPTL
jgi:hypothetical protein